MLGVAAALRFSGVALHVTKRTKSSMIHNARFYATGPAPNPFDKLKKKLKLSYGEASYYDLNGLNDKRLNKLPYSIRVLLESAVRNCDEFKVRSSDVENILNWAQTSKTPTEIQFKPARVILQDFTGVPAIVDLAAMRDATKKLGGDPSKINPKVPVDLVIDHSVQVDKFGTPEALEENERLEMERNKERFEFLKWGAHAFKNLRIVPPGSGIVHQVNLEYLSQVVFNNKGLLYPDSLVGTDSHTPMVNGLGIVGWGVGGIEAEAVMLDQPISMVLPEVIGFELTGKLRDVVNSTDLVLAITQALRKKGVVNKFVEFYGPGVSSLSLSDRATIGNMSPEMGATICYFPVDSVALDYMRLTGRTKQHVEATETYLKANGLFTSYNSSGSNNDIQFTDVVKLDLSTVQPAIAGPKRPHDLVLVSDAKNDFQRCLDNPVAGFKGFGVSEADRQKRVTLTYQGKDYVLEQGSVVIAAITSCTNTSNPSVMLAAGILAKKANALGLTVPPYVKTSLAPGSGVVHEYFKATNLLPQLEKLGFSIVGYGCTTCIGNSGPLPDAVAEAVEKNDLVVAGVLSGNRNFEGRIHPQVKANYLASPPLVVAYALAGRMRIDFEKEPIGRSSTGMPVFLKDIWPTSKEIQDAITFIKPDQFVNVYNIITKGSAAWQSLTASSEQLYPWNAASTYIHNPPYFQNMLLIPKTVTKVEKASVLLNLGDFITTDHISPAGNIAKDSAAAKYLNARNVVQKDFNSYGSRRGNDEIMARGTFANVRLINKLMSKPGPQTIYHPTGESMFVYDAAMKYKQAETPLIVLAGQMYGSGSSRDWAAKGTSLLGIKAVIAISYERIHRSNLVQFGIVPLQFKEGENADVLGLTGKEQFSFDLGDISKVKPGQEVTVTVTNGKIPSFKTILRFDTDSETHYYAHGGVLQYVIRQSLL